MALTEDQKAWLAEFVQMLKLDEQPANGNQENQGMGGNPSSDPDQKNADAPAEEDSEVNFDPPTESSQPTLRKGDQSEDGWVEYLQGMLFFQFKKQRSFDINGKFDQATHQGVLDFQAREKLMVDGIVGNQTWAALRNAKPQPPGTDGKEPGSHVETGAEARWATEKNDFTKYDAGKDDLSLSIVSIGTESIEGKMAVVRVTPATGKASVQKLPIGPALFSAPGDDASSHRVHLARFRATFGTGTHKIDAYLPKELGGDNWSDPYTLEEPGGTSPETPGGETPPGGTSPQGGGTTGATVEVVVTLDGEVQKDAKVRIDGPTPQPIQTTSGGSALFEGLAAGRHHFNGAKGPHHANTYRDLKEGDREKITIKLSSVKKPATLTVSVAGQDLQDPKVWLASKPTPVSPPATFTELDPEEHVVIATVDGAAGHSYRGGKIAAKRVTVKLTPGSTKSITIRFSGEEPGVYPDEA